MPRDGFLATTGCQWPMAIIAIRTGMRSAMIMDDVVDLYYAFQAVQ